MESNYLISNPPPETLTAGVIRPDALPLVSFCIPTKNNEDTLENCLASINRQDYPRVEIIIVDGDSKDRTVEIARRFTDKIHFDPGTYGSACQTGIDHANGRIIALLDSDIIIPDPSWLGNAIRFFNYHPSVSTVWPLCIAPPGSSRISHLYQTKLFRILIEDRIRGSRCVFGGGVIPCF